MAKVLPFSLDLIACSGAQKTQLTTKNESGKKKYFGQELLSISKLSSHF